MNTLATDHQPTATDRFVWRTTREYSTAAQRPVVMTRTTADAIVNQLRNAHLCAALTRPPQTEADALHAGLLARANDWAATGAKQRTAAANAASPYSVRRHTRYARHAETVAAQLRRVARAYEIDVIAAADT